MDGQALRPWGELKESSHAKTLYCDYDVMAAPELLPVFRTLAFVGLHIKWVRYDKTARGWHVVIRTREAITSIESVSLQALLGSDPEREKFNLARVMWARREGRRLGNRWNILYKRKIAK